MSSATQQSIRRRKGRSMLLTICALIAIAGVILWVFACHPANPWPSLKGQLFGAQMTAMVLAAVIWRRLYFGRYLLVALNWYVISVFAGAVIVIVNSPTMGGKHAIAYAAAGVSFYLAANVLLMRSRRIDSLCHRPSAGHH